MKEKLALVSYHNTTPFLAGLSLPQFDGLFDPILATPSNCAKLYMEGAVDVALVPVGGLAELDNYDIITDYCIGCDGSVYTVALLSNKPLTECTTLYLDKDSLTSVQLAKILLFDYFQKDLKEIEGIPQHKHYDKDGLYLMIGDKVFEYEDQFKFKYDLGATWKELTGLPFTFAVWIVRKGSDEKIENRLNEIFRQGMKICSEDQNALAWKHLTLKEYLTNYISFDFDHKKKEAMELFISKIGQPAV